MSDSKKEKVIDINNKSIEELKEKYKVTQEKIKEVDKKIEKLEEKRKEENKGKITLAELIYSTIKFIRGEITQSDYAEFGKTLMIRPYIPMSEKIRIVAKIQFDINNDYTGEVASAVLMKDLFYDGLLGGYALIDVSDKKLTTLENMDLLYPMIAPFILQYVNADYDSLTQMVNNCFNFYNMKDMVKILEGVDYKKIEESTKENKKIIYEIEKNKELVKDLRDIMVATNSGSKTLDSLFKAEVLAEMKEKEIKDKEKEESKEITKKSKKEIVDKNNLNSEDKSTGKKGRGRPPKKTEKK